MGKRASAGKPAPDLHQEITDQILAALETANPDDWRPPWLSMAAMGTPMNAATQAEYRGINILRLWLAAQESGFSSRRWATFRQWRDCDASVRKGERASRVVFYKPRSQREDEDEESGREVPQTRRRALLRYASVFNADQVDGYPDPEGENAEPPNAAAKVAIADELITGSGATIRWNAGRAFYDPGSDYIGLPSPELFESTAGKYSTTFHELTHWTGHSERLNRREGMDARFGGAAYAAEELVAELGAAFLCARVGIEAMAREDHATYIASWIRLLHDDKKAIATAAARASDAVAFVVERGAEHAPYEDGGAGAPVDETALALV